MRLWSASQRSQWSHKKVCQIHKRTQQSVLVYTPSIHLYYPSVILVVMSTNKIDRKTDEVKRILSDEDYELMCRFDNFEILRKSALDQLVKANETKIVSRPHDKLGGFDMFAGFVAQEVEKKNVSYILQLVLELRERTYELRKELLDERGEWDELVERKEQADEEKRKEDEEADTE